MNSTLIASKINIIRDIKVMLDFDLAALYGVETKVLKQSVRRNISRFPEDFMFELSDSETQILRSQFLTSSSNHGGLRYNPFEFTEQGIAMLSSVLKSEKAINTIFSYPFKGISLFILNCPFIRSLFCTLNVSL